MGKRVRISNSRLNSYGTRILTVGMDIEQYKRNPVFLYMHKRGEVIGYIKDIRVEGDDVTGEPVFDGASDRSIQAKKQFEFGSLRMVSAGVEILEMSDDPSYLVEGQTCPTVTRSKLYEVSLVDIGANDDSIRLYKDGNVLELGKNGENPLPTINNNKFMERKELALLLGLPDTATDAEIKAKINALLAVKAEKDTLKAQVDTITAERDTIRTERDTLKTTQETMTLAAITAAVDSAVNERRIPADKKEHFISLGKKVGLDDLKNTLAAMAPAAKASQFINTSAGGNKDYQKLSDVPADKIMELRSDDPETYKALYKAEYGVECTL